MFENNGSCNVPKYWLIVKRVTFNCLKSKIVQEVTTNNAISDTLCSNSLITSEKAIHMICDKPASVSIAQDQAGLLINEYTQHSAQSYLDATCSS